MADAGGGLSTAAPAPGPREIVAAMPAAVLAIDGDGLVRDCNPAAEALLNLGRSAIVGATVAAMIGHPLDSIVPEQPLAAYDLAMRLPGGRAYRGDLAVSPLGDRPGWRVAVIHGRASHDIAARLADRAGRALPAAAAAAILAHEIKNPLSGIRGAAQLVDGAEPAAQAGLTRLICDEVDRIAALIDRMEGLTDTRPRAMEAINVHSVLDHARGLAAAGFANGMAIRELYDPSLPEVLGNRDALVQILVNLLKNAAEAAGPAGTIMLRTAYRHGLSVAGEDGGRRALPIEIAVIDDGPGAPEAIAVHMFDAFVTSRPTGTGLGLALVEKLVDEMGGMIDYRREGEPPRTVMRLLLRRAEGAR